MTAIKQWLAAVHSGFKAGMKAYRTMRTKQRTKGAATTTTGETDGTTNHPSR